MKFYKTVLLPIEVAEGNHCWGSNRICNHFDNEGGYATCDLGFSLEGCDRGNGLILKPEKCRKLKEE